MKRCYFCGSEKVYTEIPINEDRQSQDSYPYVPVCRSCYIREVKDGAEILMGEETDARVHDDRVDF